MSRTSNLARAIHSRPFQVEGTKFIINRKRVLLADEPGLGKTLQSIASVVASQLHGSVLIVAPKTAAYVTWPAELRTWLNEVAPHDEVHIIGGKLQRPAREKLMQQVIQRDAELLDSLPDKAYRVSHMGWRPLRQWVIVSPNYLRFKAKLDDKGRYEYGPGKRKIYEPIREALAGLLDLQWQAVIVDEAHETLSGATGDLKKQSAQYTGLQVLQVAPGGLKIAISGTPYRGKYENLWGILHWLEPKKYKGYWPWVMKHFDVYRDPVFQQDIIGNLRDERGLHLETKELMVRRTKGEVVLDLPPKKYGGTPRDPLKTPPEVLVSSLKHAIESQHYSATHPTASPEAKRAIVDRAQHEIDAWHDKHNPIAVWLDLDPIQAKFYKQMKQEAMADIAGGTLLANSILAELTRLKQFANSSGELDSIGQFQPILPSAKFEWIVEFLAERGITGKEPSGNRVIIASQFTRHLNLFAKELTQIMKIPTYLLTGATSSGERQRLQEEFQNGKTRAGKPSPEVFLLNTKAGGVSLTLDAADDVVIVDSTYNRDDQIQVEDRAHRISRMHSVTVWNLVCRKTIDEQLLVSTRTMGRSIERILDNPGDILEILES